MLDIYRLNTVELAVHLTDIRAKLAALASDSSVRVAGERALVGRERLLQQMQARISVGDAPWTEPTPGEPLKVGDGFTVKGDSERLHYGITVASPGKDGKPNPLLAAFAQMAADPEPASRTPAAGGDGGPDERDPDD